MTTARALLLLAWFAGAAGACGADPPSKGRSPPAAPCTGRTSRPSTTPSASAAIRRAGSRPSAWIATPRPRRTPTPRSGAVSAGIMPPYAMVHDGSCGDFHDERALAPDEKAVIARWASGGGRRARRSRCRRPTSPRWTEPSTWSRRSSLRWRREELLAQVTTNTAASRWIRPSGAGPFLTGYDVSPGDAAIVHHVIAFIVDPAAPGLGGQSNAAIMQALDADSPDRLGWPCFGGAGPGVQPSATPVAWAPGQGMVAYPAGDGDADTEAPTSWSCRSTTTWRISMPPRRRAPTRPGSTSASRPSVIASARVRAARPLPDLAEQRPPDVLPPRQADAPYTLDAARRATWASTARSCRQSTSSP